jgi:hypothetical protein
VTVAFIHIVTFKWRDAGADSAAIADALRDLAARLDGVQSYLCGPDAGHAPGAYDFAVVGTFDDAEFFAAYRDHPEHQRILQEMILPNVEARTVVQLKD